MEGFFGPLETRCERAGRMGRGQSSINDLADAKERGLLSCATCPLRSKTRADVCMSPTGADHPILYILGEAPGEQEMVEGRHFVGASGKLLRKYIPDGWLDRIRWNNVVRNRPPRNRTPTLVEIECCRPSIVADIERSKPKVVLCVGAVALNWAVGETQITRWRGIPVPCRIGSHVCWIVPLLHPSYVLRQLKAREDSGDLFVFETDLRLLFRKLSRGFLDPVLFLEDLSQITEGCQLITCDDRSLALGLQFLDKCSIKITSVDIETNQKRPYVAGGDLAASHLVSFSVSDGATTMAFPASGHSETRWSPHQAAKLMEGFRWYLLGPGAVIVQNLAFELEWFVAMFGPDVAYSVFWHDTMAQAYVLDPRPGLKGLDRLVLRYFGFHLKSQTKVAAARLQEYPLKKVLEYNALDAKYTYPLFEKQLAELDARKMGDVYRDQVRRIPSSVLMQAKGLRVDYAHVEQMARTVWWCVAEANREIASDPMVAKYQARLGRPFNPASSKACIEMMRDICNSSVGKRGKKFSADREALEASGLPIAILIQKLRDMQKLGSTWVEPYKRGVGKSLHPDGRIHTQYNMSLVMTRRTSSSEPNMQNFPKHRNAEVRKIIIPEPGCKFVSCDYAQMEARVIAMHSKDKALVNAIWSGYDIHMAWAKRILELWPSALKARDNDWKKLRYVAKNSMVFPAFYGSGVTAVAHRLEVSAAVGKKLLEEFWAEFPGVREWQKKVLDTYHRLGYVLSLTGFRRPAPLRPTQIMNTAIQGDASDFTVEAANRLSRLALESGQPLLQPVMNVHDDLTFVVPDELVEETIPIITTEMLQIPYEWVNVPIAVGVAVGDSWGNMQNHSEVSSNGSR